MNMRTKRRKVARQAFEERKERTLKYLCSKYLSIREAIEEADVDLLSKNVALSGLKPPQADEIWTQRQIDEAMKFAEDLHEEAKKLPITDD